jgi:hypothetical protein
MNVDHDDYNLRRGLFDTPDQPIIILSANNVNAAVQATQNQAVYQT